MSTDCELATIFSFSTAGQELNSLLTDPRVSIDLNLSDDIKYVLKVLDSYSIGNNSDTPIAFDEHSPLGIEFSINVLGLEDRYKNVELNKYDTARVGVSIQDEFQNLLTDTESLLLRLYLNNQDIRYVDNFLGASAVEYIFSYWKPKYSWLAYYATLYDFKLGKKLDSSYYETPWLHYSDTMIFGPELVESMKLKDFDWQDEDIFFAEWITDDIFWLASPMGQHTRFQNFGTSYLNYQNATNDIREKHSDLVCKRLKLKSYWM